VKEEKECKKKITIFKTPVAEKTNEVCFFCNISNTVHHAMWVPITTPRRVHGMRI